MSRIHEKLMRHGRHQLELLAESKAERQIVAIASAFMSEEHIRAGFTHPGLCLTVLPHRATPNDTVWERKTLNTRLSIQPIRAPDSSFKGVPYGANARMILLYLQTEAVRSNSKRIELGRSMHQWLRRMGVSTGGKNYSLIAGQAERIENCILRFEHIGAEGDTRWQDSIIRGSFTNFGDRKTGPNIVELSETFFQAIKQHPVPLNESAIRLLSNRCLPLDIYLWLAYRLHSIDNQTEVSWPSLHAQFGAATKLLKHFKPRFNRALELALAVYPEARVNQIPRGIVLCPSSPPIAPRRPASVASVRIAGSGTNDNALSLHQSLLPLATKEH